MAVTPIVGERDRTFTGIATIRRRDPGGRRPGGLGGLARGSVPVSVREAWSIVRLF
jgi:hypothetical protein